jgi:hypothetical protein
MRGAANDLLHVQARFFWSRNHCNNGVFRSPEAGHEPVMGFLSVFDIARQFVL